MGIFIESDRLNRIYLLLSIRRLVTDRIMKFLIFCVLWIVIFFFEYLVGMESFHRVSGDILFVVTITSSWCIAMLIVLAKKVLSFSFPVVTHQIHGILATRIDKSAKVDGIFEFDGSKAIFNKIDKNRVAWPDMEFYYNKIKSFGYNGSQESIFIATPKGKFVFVTTTERALHVLENLSNHTGLSF